MILNNFPTCLHPNKCGTFVYFPPLQTNTPVNYIKDVRHGPQANWIGFQGMEKSAIRNRKIPPPLRRAISISFPIWAQWKRFFLSSLRIFLSIDHPLHDSLPFIVREAIAVVCLIGGDTFTLTLFTATFGKAEKKNTFLNNQIQTKTMHS